MKRQCLFYCFMFVVIFGYSQQPTYTKVYNVKDSFDYGLYTVPFDNKVYIKRQILASNVTEFFDRVDIDGQLAERYYLIPKLGYFKQPFMGSQVGSKLFLVGTEHDTATIHGNLTVLNKDMSVFYDTVIYDYPNMEIDMGRYDSKRHKFIAIYSHSVHKDSTEQRQWGIMEFDTMGVLQKKQPILPQVRFEFADNLLVTSDGGYLVSGKRNGRTTYIDPFFVKFDTNFNIIWRNDLAVTNEKFFTQYVTENLLELPNNKGFVFLAALHRPFDTINRKCRYSDNFSALSFLSTNGQLIKNYYHNITNKYCEASIPKGIFLKNDSVLMIFTQRDTTVIGNNSNEDSSSSVVIYYNFNQHRAVKEIIGGQLLNGKTPLIFTGYSGVCFRTHVGRDIDRGFLTSGFASINDNNGMATYLMKTDSCGYTEDHRCKIVYHIGKQNGKSLNLYIIDSLSVLCQPIWTVEGTQYIQPNITHNFSAWGWHHIKIWGFAGSSVDSFEFNIYIDSNTIHTQTTAIEETRVYPNPASDYIEVVLSSKSSPSIYTSITNLLGQKMIQTEDRKIDVSHLPNGVYYVLITDRNGDVLEREKLIIQR